MFFRRKTHEIKKKRSLKIFEANCAYAADTISRSQTFFRTHDKILLFILILSAKRVIACNTQYLIPILPSEAATVLMTLQEKVLEKVKNTKIAMQ
jgi:hypothetical protein